MYFIKQIIKIKQKLYFFQTKCCRITNGRTVMCELNLMTVVFYTEVFYFFLLITVKLCNIFQKIIQIMQIFYLFKKTFKSSTSKCSTLFDKIGARSSVVFLFVFCPISPCFSFYVCPITIVWNCKFAWTIE